MNNSIFNINNLVKILELGGFIIFRETQVLQENQESQALKEFRWVNKSNSNAVVALSERKFKE